MRKFIIAIITINLLFSCNDDENNTIIVVTTEDFETTINENPSPMQEIGNVIGSSNNGDVIFEIESQIPEGAFSIDTESGLLMVADATKFDFELNTIITGIIKVSNEDVFMNSNITISINDIEDSAENPIVYAYNNSSKKIVELNLDDGSEIGIIADLMFDQVFFNNIVYSKTTNEIIGTFEVPQPYPNESDFYFTRINVTNGQVNSNLINTTSYKGFTLTNEGRLYTYRSRSTDRKIVELNPNNGSEIRIIADLDIVNENDFSGNLVYSETVDELIGIQYLIGNPYPTFYYWLARINPVSGIFTKSTMEQNYDKILMSDEGKLYAYNLYDNIIAELDPINASVIGIIANLESSIFRHIVYSETTNELIGILNYGSSLNNYDLTRVNIENGQVTQVPLQIPPTGNIYDFILVNQ